MNLAPENWISLVGHNIKLIEKLLAREKIKLIFSYSGNGIGSEGAQALAESLKENTTLTQLNLRCMSDLSEFMFTSTWRDQTNIFHIQITALALKEHRLWLSL